jgi:Zn-dependent metalloprotease
MAYYWVTEAQKYIQSLGFGVEEGMRPINMEPQKIRINQLGLDNSYSWDKFDMLRFGKGGVDDAEDAEVILHEYGHAMMDSQSEPFGNWGLSVESGAIGEGFADYVAISITDVIAPTADTACVADWDAVSYDPTEPHCLRRVDEDMFYPDDLVGQVHSDGRIWSRALWEILQALGHEKADTLILESVFSYAPDSDMPSAALEVVNAARQLYGRRTAKIVEAIFQSRGILP